MKLSGYSRCASCGHLLWMHAAPKPHDRRQPCTLCGVCKDFQEQAALDPPKAVQA